jgi:hypothetical protein
MEEWRYSSTILDLGSRWRWVVSFTPRQLYPRAKNWRCPLDRKLGEPQYCSWRCGGKKNLAPVGKQTPAFQPVAIPTEISWLQLKVAYTQFNDSECNLIMLNVMNTHVELSAESGNLQNMWKIQHRYSALQVKLQFCSFYLRCQELTTCSVEWLDDGG